MKHVNNSALIDSVFSTLTLCNDTGYKKDAMEALDEIKRRLPSDEEREAISTRINNDGNGNPRYVAHFLKFITPEDEAWAKEMEKKGSTLKFAISYQYERALARAKKLGGKKFHNKQYGGGIVFQCYGEKEMRELAEHAKAIKL